MSDFTATPDAEDWAELPSNWQNHPEVQRFFGDLEALKEQTAAFKAELDAIRPALAKAKQDKDAFEQSIAEQLAAHRAKVREMQQMEQNVASLLVKTQQSEDALRGNFVMLLAGLEAHAELEATQAEWEMILADQDWLWVKSIFEYQKTGCEFIASGLRRGIFGVALLDQMGLGKTLQATAAINLIQYTEDYEEIIAPRIPRMPQPTNGNYPACWYSVLWVCPNSIKSSTMREIAKWSSDLKVVKLEGNAAERDALVRMAHDQGLVLVVSYEQLRQRNDMDLTPALFEFDWPLVVMDEAHRFKNETSGTFMNVERVCNNAGYVIPMTGTPVPNRPIEMWSILHMLTLKGKYEGKFADSSRFETDYLGWASTPTNARFLPGAYDRLIDNVKDMVLRRRKDEVLLDLPDKIREVRFVELTGQQRDCYEQMRTEFFIWLDEQKSDFVSGQNMLAQMTYLRQIALLPAGVTLKGNPDQGTVDRHLDIWESAKIDDAIGIIEDLLESDEKVLVFSNFNAPLKYLLQRVEDLRYTTDIDPRGRREIETGLIIGGVDERKRDVIAARFADPEDSLMVVAGNIAAMGVGLNLQGACSHAIFLDLFWNPGVNEQAEDRIHRQGQRSNVTIHIIQAENTIDGFIAKKIEDKAMMIEGMIERDELRQALQDGLI